MSIEISLVAVECRDAVESAVGLEEKLKAAFAKAQNHWMVTNENQQFAGAVAAVYEKADDETKERIRIELEGIKALRAMLSGVPVDIDRIEKHESPIGLMKLWHEAVDSGKARK